MLYFLLITDEENQIAQMSEEDMGQLMADYESFGAELDKAGICKASHRLQPVATATSVRVRNGEILHTDGPFAETKEQLGGFYAIEVANLDEALAWAAKIPSAKIGTIEVRPEWAM
ncbi:MAG: hypothetical protein COA70_07870 [Planctomycetota bacterium]|nr:MAG: hypothetical protein COA70_07870 [Planctomycetota bacterium]